MDKFIWGNDLFDRALLKKPQTSTLGIPNRKAFCESHNPEEMENAFSKLFAQLRQEHTSLNSKISRGELLKSDKSGRDGSCLVRLTFNRGNLLRKYGFALADGSQCLYPEEAYYLSQCDKLQVYDGGLPLSLQQLFNTLFRNDSEVANYLAYARLTKQGFVLRRRKNLSESNVQPLESKIITLPIDQSSQEFKTKSTQGAISDEVFVVSPLSKPFSETPDFASPRSFYSHDFNPAKYEDFTVFDVYDDRKGNFKKNMSTEPKFVLLVLLSNDMFNFPPNECFRRNFGVKPETEILVAVVNNGDVHFICVKSFSIPTIKRILI
nr:tRNA splicing endonuclease subunit Sen54 [Hymenolepis microstoma]